MRDEGERAKGERKREGGRERGCVTGGPQQGGVEVVDGGEDGDRGARRELQWSHLPDPSRPHRER